MRLGQNVMDAAGLQDIAHAGAGFHARARTGRYQNYPAAAKPAHDPMPNPFPFELDFAATTHGILPTLTRLFDGRGDFVGLTVAGRNFAMPVAHDHEGIKAKPPASLDYGRAATDLDHPFLKPILPRFSIS